MKLKFAAIAILLQLNNADNGCGSWDHNTSNWQRDPFWEPDDAIPAQYFQFSGSKLTINLGFCDTEPVLLAYVEEFDESKFYFLALDTP